MINLRQIAEGYINLAISGTIIASEKIEELSKARITICKACISFDDTNKSCNLKTQKGCCKHCGCFMKAKTRVLNAVCGDKENPKW